MLRDDLLKMMENFISRRPACRSPTSRRGSLPAIASAFESRSSRQTRHALPPGLFRKMIVETAEGARARIRSWNDGIYRHMVFIDTTGFDAALIRTPVASIKRDDHILIDLTGASPSTRERSRRSRQRCGRTAR